MIVGNRRATLLLADISGYTRFLGDVGTAHGPDLERGETPAAYPLMTTLLDSIVADLSPPCAISKLEGDAVFAYADEGSLGLHGQQILDRLDDCYAAFRRHVLRTEQALTCTCEACVSVSTLDLKFVLHHGSYVAQTIAGAPELMGPDVTIAHRMLKNDVTEVTGWRAYALVTAVTVDHFGIPREGGRMLTLDYEHVAPFEAIAFPMP